MSLRLWPVSLMMGQSSRLGVDWNMNDGIVNTISMKYPINSNNEEAPHKKFNKEKIEKGIWQVMDLVHSDHNAVIGHFILDEEQDELKSFFLKICEQLSNLD